MEQQTELYDLRLHRLEQLTASMVESQASMVQVLQEHSVRLANIESRLDRVEELLTLALDDLAFIKNHLERRE